MLQRDGAILRHLQEGMLGTEKSPPIKPLLGFTDYGDDSTSIKGKYT